jgi:hypothetical protein
MIPPEPIILPLSSHQWGNVPILGNHWMTMVPALRACEDTSFSVRCFRYLPLRRFTSVSRHVPVIRYQRLGQLIQFVADRNRSTVVTPLHTESTHRPSRLCRYHELLGSGSPTFDTGCQRVSAGSSLRPAERPHRSTFCLCAATPAGSLVAILGRVFDPLTHGARPAPLNRSTIPRAAHRSAALDFISILLR